MEVTHALKQFRYPWKSPNATEVLISLKIIKAFHSFEGNQEVPCASKFYVT